MWLQDEIVAVRELPMYVVGRVQPRSPTQAPLSLQSQSVSAASRHALQLLIKLSLSLTLNGWGHGLCPGKRLAHQVPGVVGMAFPMKKHKVDFLSPWGSWAEPESGA